MKINPAPQGHPDPVGAYCNLNPHCDLNLSNKSFPNRRLDTTVIIGCGAAAMFYLLHKNKESALYPPKCYHIIASPNQIGGLAYNPGNETPLKDHSLTTVTAPRQLFPNDLLVGYVAPWIEEKKYLNLYSAYFSDPNYPEKPPSRAAIGHLLWVLINGGNLEFSSGRAVRIQKETTNKIDGSTTIYTVTTDQGRQLTGTRIVIATGQTPKAPLEGWVENNYNLLNPYRADLSDCLNTAYSAETVAIVGGSALAIELAIQIGCSPDSNTKKIVLVSPTGLLNGFQFRDLAGPNPQSYLPNLTALNNDSAKNFGTTQLKEAFEKDIKVAKANSARFDPWAFVKKAVPIMNKLINQLRLDDAQSFASKIGPELWAQVGFYNPEQLTSITRLIESGKLEVQPGRITSVKIDSEGLVGLFTKSGELVIQANCVIDCRGFKPPFPIEDPVLIDALKSLGYENEQIKALNSLPVDQYYNLKKPDGNSSEITVIGPQLAGNLIGENQRLWQVPLNFSRTYQLAKQAAQR